MKKINAYFSDVEWFVAIRKHCDSPLETQDMAFSVLKNNWRYWCADPFLLERDGKTYLFMEVYDRFRQQGYIGYRTLENNKVSPIRVCLKTQHHMSYPFLYERNDDIYMLPECYQSGELTLYRAVEFPHKWERAEVLLDGKPLCDTNIVEDNGNRYLLTTEIHGTPFVYDQLSLYEQRQGTWYASENNPVIQGVEHARNGGGIFLNAGRMIRPAQNCAGEYGDSLVLREITNLSTENYSETDLRALSVSEIRIINSNRKFDGVHTFNVGSQYDVIDLRISSTVQPLKFFALLRNKIHSIFGR